MFNDAFGSAADASVDLFPADLAEEQSQLSEFMYNNVNTACTKRASLALNGHTRKPCALFSRPLDKLEPRLAATRYLFDDRIVEPTGDYSAPWFASMRSITGISSATSAALSITQIWMVTCAIYISSPG